MIAGTRLLVVDDDPAVLDALSVALGSEGFQVTTASDAAGAERRAEEFRPDLAILDVRLPGGTEGFELGSRLRARGGMPLIYLTAADGLDDRLAGFGIGADDYLVKPFAIAELVARVRAVLRRVGGDDAGAVWQLDRLVVDEGAHVVSWDGTSIDLTPKEFELLVALAKRPGRVLSKTQLLAEVWGFKGYDPNVVEVHISALRKKLPDDAQSFLQTVRGVGYVARAR